MTKQKEAGDEAGVVADAARRRVIGGLMAGGVALALPACRAPAVSPPAPPPTSEAKDSTMTIDAHVDTYRGKRVVDFRMGDRPTAGDVVYRLYQDYDTSESQKALVEYFFTQVAPASIETLVIGPWQVSHDDGPDGILDVLVARKTELGALRALYVGDITSEENEMSWIIQTAYAPLLAAFPQLESLRIRGSDRLDIAPIQHAHLAELAIETGGMPSKIVTAIAKSTLPALKHLELWLGDDNYGFDGDLKTYADLLAAIDPSRLTYLGLRNAQISDELAVHVAAQPWLARLETLDLSMGTIGDAGARALHDSPHVRSLKRLDLSHHYIGEEWQRKLAAMPLTVVLDDPQDVEDTDGDRYVEVGE